MTVETKERPHYETIKTYVKTVADHYEKRRSWIHCPRCIGGNMYKDESGEYNCVQCGCRYNPPKP